MYDIEKITIVHSVEEAVHALQSDCEARIIAGGSDVLIKIREGEYAGCRLVSIREITSLHGIKLEDDGTIFIGPLTTFSEIIESPIIQKYIDVLGFAADQVGGPQIRNIGTVGGNISNGVTGADTASTLCALNAVIEITGPAKDNPKKLAVRHVPLQDYYVKAGKVCLEPGELCTGIRIYKKDYEGYKGSYIKYAMRNAMDIATLGCSVVSKITEASTGDKIMQDIRIAFGVAGPVPLRCRQTEEKLRNLPINENFFYELSHSIIDDINPRTSWRASKDFRLQLAQELPVRALKQNIGETL
ncbi:MAG: xanthine dehydrogenase subunit XdhB [Spirochaetales bacterium]